MNYAQASARRSPRLLVAFGSVIVLYVALIEVLINGLGQSVVEVIPAPLQTRLIEEVKPPPSEPAKLPPQPEVHVRGDEEGRYEAVGRVVFDCQRAGIARVGFITEPPPHG